MYCVCLNASMNQLRLTLSTLHAETCCCKHTISTVWATHVEPRNHEELRHVGLAPIALCELMSREKVSQNDFAVAKLILPWVKRFCREWKWFCRGEIDFAVSEIDFAVAKLILPWVKRFCREWKWFCRGEIDFAVSKKILPWQLWATVDLGMWSKISLTAWWAIHKTQEVFISGSGSNHYKHYPNSCTLYERTKKVGHWSVSWSWTFQHKSFHLCLLPWCLPGFITIVLMTTVLWRAWHNW